MSDLLRMEDFQSHLNQTFQIEVDGRKIEMELVEVNPGSEIIVAQYGEDERPPFSIVFRSPKEVVLPQLLYKIRHEEMGELQLFIVPIGPDKQGMLYEAVFA